MERGGTSAAVRHWIETLPGEFLAEPERPDAPVFEPVFVEDRLSGAERHAVDKALFRVFDDGRDQLFEHEVYGILALVGAISPPHHVFLTTEDIISEQALARFPGAKVALKLVSPDIVHKSDHAGVAFVPRDIDLVRAAIDQMIARHRATADVRGVLVVEFVEHDAVGLGNELFVGVRTTREFGPVVAAGIGGIDTEYLASRMKPGAAVAKAIATETSAEEFLELFKRTAAYDLLAGIARGHDRIVSDGELLRCFRAFIHLARHFCVDRGDEAPDLGELEVNPFAFRQQRMIPLDGRGRLQTAPKARPARATERITNLLQPRSMAILGVSATHANFGRMILDNVLQCGFDPAHLYVIKGGIDALEGIRCVPSIGALPEPVDLLVLAAGASQLPDLVDEIAATDKAESAILVSGGAGETEGSEELAERLHKAIAAARAKEGGGPIFLGPNSLGVISRPGRYDTFFIPASRMDKGLDRPPKRVALLSQSGAFILTRMSNLDNLDPAFAVGIGNQFDLTHSDLLAAVGSRDDVDTVGIYVEGLDDLDGLALIRAIADLRAQDTDVVLYKAGRTEQGRSAAAGHTASVAGDYDVCLAAAAQAGALVARTFKEFEQLLELASAMHGKAIGGVRIGAISNAGYETVGMADAVRGSHYKVEIAAPQEQTLARIGSILADRRLGGLVNARNPLDLTPMADDAVYDQAVQAFLEDDNIDAAVVGIVPQTATLQALPPELSRDDALPRRLGAVLANHDKPLITVLDSGPLYDPLARELRDQGVPVFRSADQAIRSLGLYLCHRVGA